MNDDQQHQRLLNNSLVFKISRVMFRIALPFLGGLRVSGHENIPLTGPVLICPNHTSDLDPVVICAGTDRPDLNALAKSDLFEIPVMGKYFHLIGATPVVRDSPDRGALRIAESILRAGRMLLVFPEGRTSKTGQLADVQLGAAMLALKTCTPISPCGIRGTRNILPYGKVIPHFAGGGVTVNYGKPIYPSRYEEMPHRLAQRTMAADLRTEIAGIIGQS